MPTVNIVLAHNYQGSITRVAWNCAKVLAERGWPVTVLYPVVMDQFDYYWWRCPVERRIRFWARLAAKAIVAKAKGRISRSQWVGESVFGRRAGMSAQPYLVVPTDRDVPEADFLLCLQPQLLPWLLRLSHDKGEIVDSIRTSDYTKDESMKAWFDHVFMRICRHASVKRFAVSRASRDFFWSQGIRVDEVIPNGIDMSEFPFNSYDTREPGILMFSDPHTAKGYQFGVRVLERLKAKYPTLKTASVGNVSGLNIRIFDDVHGFVSGEQISSIYQRYRHFLFPSLYEGFPSPPLEAMATGAVAILARVSGIEEYGQDGVNCVTFTPGNLDEAVQAAERVLCDEGLARTVALAGRTVAETYSWEHSIDALIALMRRNETPAVEPSNVHVE